MTDGAIQALNASPQSHDTSDEAPRLSESEERLRVYLLGPPAVAWGNHPLLIPRRQARALLYRLATRLQPVPREQLCFLFWPDAPEATARRHLSHLLTHLRRALPIPELLLVAADQIALDASRVWSDVATFEQLCATPTPSPRHPPSPPPTLGEGKGGRGDGVRAYNTLSPSTAGRSWPASPSPRAPSLRCGPGWSAALRKPCI